MSAFGLLRRLRDPDEASDASAWSERERLARLRGEPVPPRPVAPPSHVILDESGDGRACDGPRFGIESVRVFEELQTLGGSASRRVLYNRVGGLLRGFVPDGIQDLQRLGVVSERGSGWETVVRLEPGYERARLVSRWSRATW